MFGLVRSRIGSRLIEATGSGRRREGGIRERDKRRVSIEGVEGVKGAGGHREIIRCREKSWNVVHRRQRGAFRIDTRVVTRGDFLILAKTTHQPPGGRRPRHGQGISLCITPEVDKGSLLAVRASRYTITIFAERGSFAIEENSCTLYFEDTKG
jgi:hypothetical protein